MPIAFCHFLKKLLDKNMPKDKLICIIGPTGVGKSAVAVDLALALGGEIINADSRQVYMHMNIGTAKPSVSEKQGIRHHLLDIVEPNEVFSVAMYQEKAKDVIRDIVSRQKLPILVGGSGQYIWSLLEGWQIPAVKPNEELRARLETLGQTEEGKLILQEELRRVDLPTYQRIDLKNTRRLIRALETFHQEGTPFSSQRQKTSSDYDALIVGLTMDRRSLYAKVDERVEQMMRDGLLLETEQLLQRYPHKHSILATIGYKQLTAYINNESTLQEALQAIKFETHRYIRQQYTWFKPQDERIHWFTLSKQADKMVTDDIKQIMMQFLDNKIKGI